MSESIKQWEDKSKEMELMCPFCSELNAERIDNPFLNLCGDLLTSRILWETENFVVVPSLGQIVEGYLLILPKMHYLAIGYLPVALFPELQRVKEAVREILTEAYTQPIFYEHGPVSERQKGGSCVDHAHLHAVPVNVDLHDYLCRVLPSKRISSLLDLTKEIENGRPYLFYESRSGAKFIYPAENVPCQYLRRILAQMLGVPRKWHWAVYTGRTELVSTYTKLRPLFQCKQAS